MRAQLPSPSSASVSIRVAPVESYSDMAVLIVAQVPELAELSNVSATRNASLPAGTVIENQSSSAAGLMRARMRPLNATVEKTLAVIAVLFGSISQPPRPVQ